MVSVRDWVRIWDGVNIDVMSDLQNSGSESYRLLEIIVHVVVSSSSKVLPEPQGP